MRAPWRARDRRPRIVTRTPRATAPVVWPALLLAVALVGAAVVGVRDLLVSQGWLAGSPWVGAVVEGSQGLDVAETPWWIAVPAALAGAVLVVAALRPARRTHRAARDGLDLWLTPDAVAAIAQSAADRVHGVVSAEAAPRWSGRRIRVRVQVREDRDEVRDRVRERLREVGVDGLVPGSRITVRAQEVGR